MSGIILETMSGVQKAVKPDICSRLIDTFRVIWHPKHLAHMKAKR